MPETATKVEEYPVGYFATAFSYEDDEERETYYTHDDQPDYSDD